MCGRPSPRFSTTTTGPIHLAQRLSRVGFFRAFDEPDTGNETTGYRLPSGPFDVSLLLSDKRFDPRLENSSSISSISTDSWATITR